MTSYSTPDSGRDRTVNVGHEIIKRTIVIVMV